MIENDRKTIMDLLKKKTVQFYEAKMVKNKFEIEIVPLSKRTARNSRANNSLQSGHAASGRRAAERIR